MNKDVFKGRGASISPDNPYLKRREVLEHIEGLDEEKYINKPQTKFYKEHTKGGLSKNDSPDLPLNYSVNPYQGCEHGCIYCYARNSHQYWGFDAGLGFETNIMVKTNIVEVLREQFKKKGHQPQAIMLSGNTDCYQPAERKFKLTRKILELCLEMGHPVSVITKNTLILRDQDILAKLADKQLVHVYFSINHLDHQLKALLEPRTATGQKKIAAIKTLKDRGVPCGIMVAPIIPALNTMDIADIIRQSADAGALAAGYTVVRLNGNVKEVFKHWIKEHYPERADKVLHQIEQLHGGKLNDTEWGRRIKGSGIIAEMIHQIFNTAKQKYMKDRSMPDFNYDAFNPHGQLKLF
ncbi:PA0069 family radical SAM protein [Echinicola sp. CAU 1574]|uniref:PA0069 family radical SAM protein n=1 Tax=Echinicola arenosa TaxID=2774144 RepID=A0ABR9AKD1_9BACT|nr:PA0069 family radical SAM protein [Echinicola arenosa]MBD8489268.1 PA0069 family radical SAM protein [Echinicola arenosa]